MHTNQLVSLEYASFALSFCIYVLGHQGFLSRVCRAAIRCGLRAFQVPECVPHALLGAPLKGLKGPTIGTTSVERFFVSCVALPQFDDPGRPIISLESKRRSDTVAAITPLQDMIHTCII